MQRKVNVVEDLDGNKIVVIHDIRFKGRQAIEWSDVEKYLKQYVGEAHIIESTNDMVYIGVDLPEEYAHSNYTNTLKGSKYGRYSYVTRFALPVYGENGDIERYNVFRAIVLVRHAEDKRLYLYDIMKIKKETSTHFQPEDLTQSKNRFFLGCSGIINL